MSLESAIATGAAVALATTFDDNIYLTSFFGRALMTIYISLLFLEELAAHFVLAMS